MLMRDFEGERDRAVYRLKAETLLSTPGSARLERLRRMHIWEINK